MLLKQQGRGGNSSPHCLWTSLHDLTSFHSSCVCRFFITSCLTAQRTRFTVHPPPSPSFLFPLILFCLCSNHSALVYIRNKDIMRVVAHFYQQSNFEWNKPNSTLLSNYKSRDRLFHYGNKDSFRWTFTVKHPRARETITNKQISNFSRTDAKRRLEWFQPFTFTKKTRWWKHSSSSS